MGAFYFAAVEPFVIVLEADNCVLAVMDRPQGRVFPGGFGVSMFPKRAYGVDLRNGFLSFQTEYKSCYTFRSKLFLRILLVLCGAVSA